MQDNIPDEWVGDEILVYHQGPNLSDESAPYSVYETRGELTAKNDLGILLDNRQLIAYQGILNVTHRPYTPHY